MARVRVHEYPQLRCPFPHESFAGDFKELVERVTDVEMANEFINTHHNDYLYGLVSQIPSLLHSRIRLSAHSNTKPTNASAIKRYLNQRWERERQAKHDAILREHEREQTQKNHS